MLGNCMEMCSEYIDKNHPEYKKLPGAERRARGLHWDSYPADTLWKNGMPTTITLTVFGDHYYYDDYYQQGFGTAQIGLRLIMEP